MYSRRRDTADHHAVRRAGRIDAVHSPGRLVAPRTLYDRLGGIYSIATVVDDFIDRIMVDARLNANPRVDEAHHRVLPPGFKYLVTEMVGEATGGPQRYTGRTMEDSHRDLTLWGTGREAGPPFLLSPAERCSG